MRFAPRPKHSKTNRNGVGIVWLHTSFASTRLKYANDSTVHTPERVIKQFVNCLLDMFCFLLCSRAEPSTDKHPAEKFPEERDERERYDDRYLDEKYPVDRYRGGGERYRRDGYPPERFERYPVDRYPAERRDSYADRYRDRYSEPFPEDA